MIGSPFSLKLYAGLVLVLLLTTCHSTYPPLAAPEQSPELGQFRVVTLNTGSGKAVKAAAEENAGFGPEQSALADQWYGNGLAWSAFIEEVQQFFKHVDPDIVGLQEIFYSGHCPGIPRAARKDFVCEHWQPGDRTVAELILGDAYQIACHPGRPDKCLAVHRRLGEFIDCDQSFCLEGLTSLDDGYCGRGGRTAGTQIQLKTGGKLSVVHLHTSSGASLTEARCRSRQIKAAFTGDKTPPEFGLILGDFNTDPGRLTWVDPSSRTLARQARPPSHYRFISDVGLFTRPTFLGFLNIDHVLAAGMEGECWYPGRTPGKPPISKNTYLDHTAVVCDVKPYR